MPRPANATVAEVVLYLEECRETGADIDRITASNVQKRFGGRYERCVTLLQEARAAFDMPRDSEPAIVEAALHHMQPVMEDALIKSLRAIEHEEAKRIAELEEERDALREERNALQTEADQLRAAGERLERALEHERAALQRLLQITAANMGAAANTNEAEEANVMKPPKVRDPMRKDRSPPLLTTRKKRSRPNRTLNTGKRGYTSAWF